MDRSRERLLMEVRRRLQAARSQLNTGPLSEADANTPVDSPLGGRPKVLQGRGASGTLTLFTPLALQQLLLTCSKTCLQYLSPGYSACIARPISCRTVAASFKMLPHSIVLPICMLGEFCDCRALAGSRRLPVSGTLARLVLNLILEMRFCGSSCVSVHAGTPGQYWRTLEEVEAEGSNPVGRDAPSPWVHPSLHASSFTLHLICMLFGILLCFVTQTYVLPHDLVQTACPTSIIAHLLASWLCALALEHGICLDLSDVCQ